ncbi:MAG: hypothetical protein P1V51_05885 [Deltaproteobacteria bacterium]|nr:hypothetical protein [Deltaproteobacteria bacterium]
MSRAQAISAHLATLPAEHAPAPRPQAKRPSAPTPARIDPQMAAALIELLREQRVDASGEIADDLAARGSDGMVCAFLGDDLREIAHSLADVEAWVQGTLDVLERPSAATLFEQAVEVQVLSDIEHLFQTVDNLRRRLMQASVGLR